MNRRQEFVLWTAGLIVAVVCAHQGYLDGDWIYAYVVPIVIVAMLVIYRLRESRPPAADAKVGGAAIGILLALSFLAFHHARRADDLAASAADDADNALERIERLENEFEDPERRSDAAELARPQTGYDSSAASSFAATRRLRSRREFKLSLTRESSPLTSFSVDRASSYMWR